MSDEPSEQKESPGVHAEEAKMLEVRQYERPERDPPGMGAFAAGGWDSSILVFAL